MPIDRTSDPEQVYLCEADAAVLAAVVAHPFRLPSAPEIEFVASDHEPELVERRVDRLVEQELLESVRFEDGPTGPCVPETFFGTTAFGGTVLRRRLGEDRERELAEAYARLEKPAWIELCERAPRPSRE